MRIFYKAVNFAIDKTITVFFIKPDLQKSEMMEFTEWGEGLYYLDMVFCEFGPYVGKFFENDVPTVVQVFRRGKIPGVVYYNVKGEK